MSTSIYKVSDGSTITFKKRGPELYAVLSTPSGQVINGPSRIANTEESAAREILLANNIVDPNSGEPLPYTIEGKQDQSNSNTKGNNYVYDIPRKSMSEVTDETALNIAKANQKVLEQDNQTKNEILESELPPEVRLTNFINSQKATIKKRLIPFAIGLITPYAPTIIPIVVSQLGISGDSSIDSIKANAQAKRDEAQAKIDAARDQTENAIASARETTASAKEAAKDKEKLKEITKKIQATSIGALLLSQLPIEQLRDQINCPSSALITSTIQKRDSLAIQINGIYSQIQKLTSLQTTAGQIITTVTIGINLVAAAPPQTVPGAFIVNHEKLANALKVSKTVINTLTLTLASFGVFLGTILKLLEALDVILQICASDQNMNPVQINDEINALANPTIVATQNDNTNTYKGFTLGVKIDETNESRYIRRYAVAQNKQGVDVLRTESSFASDPAVLITQLKFIIDSNSSITAE
jgi:hypothetical protein